MPILAKLRLERLIFLRFVRRLNDCIRDSKEIVNECIRESSETGISQLIVQKIETENEGSVDLPYLASKINICLIHGMSTFHLPLATRN